MNAVEFHNVTKKRKDFVIDDLNITVPKGYVTGFIGPNGSGKTTTLHMLMDIVQANCGDIRLFDEPHHNAPIKQHIGFVHDDLYMYEQFNIKQMKAMIAPLYDTWDTDLFHHYLTLFELPMKKKIKKFSKGMRMKCSLLFALAHNPKLLIMDEPTSGLDPVFRRELLDLLHELMLQDERTILLSSHITSDLDRLADYIILIDKGEVVMQKAMDELSETFHVVKGKSTMIDADTTALFSGLEMTKVGFSALFEGDPELFADFSDDVIVEKATLEDIMYFLTRKRVHGGMDYETAHQA